MTSRRNALVQAANELVENLVPVILVLPRSKKALPHPETGSWWIVRETEDVESATDGALQAHGDCNLAILLGEQYESPVVAVDLDDRAAMERARELGVSSSENVWIQRTGGGKGYQVIYDTRDIGGALKRRVRAGGHLLDLLTDGYCLV